MEMLDVKEAAWRGGVYIFTVYIYCAHTVCSHFLSPAAGTDMRVGCVQPVQDSPRERQQGECRGDCQGKHVLIL